MGEISSGVITTVFNFLILGLVGNIGVAAYGVIANFALVAMAIFNGVSQGAQPIVSDCYGKGDVKSVRKIRNLGLATALGIAVVLIGAVYGFTDSLVSLFNSEHSAELAAYAHTGMRLYFIGFLFAGINIVGAGFLSATERARESFVTSVMRGFCLHNRLLAAFCRSIRHQWRVAVVPGIRASHSHRDGCGARAG